MSDPAVFTRRDFLKLVGIGVAGAAAGCAKPPTEKLIPYLNAPEDILPGVAYYYASTCRECPVGCGIVVKTREARAIKIEGNPEHPVGRGGLCARGHAGLQGLYDPDRVKSPMMKQGGAWKAVTWDAAIATVTAKLAEAKGKVLLVTGHESGSLGSLAGEFIAGAGGEHVMFEPFAYESVRAANAKTLGLASVPRYDLAAARCVVSFGADFLETFAVPTNQARGFAAMRAKHEDGAGHFVAVEPRLSLTGANADEWVAVRPGGEMALALGMAHVILAEGLGSGVDASLVAAFTPQAVAASTDVSAETIQRLARMFAKHRPSLALAGGISTQSSEGTALVAAVNLLNFVVGNIGTTVKFDSPLSFDGVASFAEFKSHIDRMGSGEVGLLLVHGANPAYATPKWAGFGAAAEKVPFKVSFTSVLDETAELCDLILPSTHALESWGDAQTARGVHSLQQASMRPVTVFDARPFGDTLITLGKAAGFGAAWPDAYFDYLKARWQSVHGRMGAGQDFESFWLEAVQKGGVWEDASSAASSAAASWSGAPEFKAPQYLGGGDFTLVIAPSNHFHDGRGANKPWLQETPDMTAKAVWGSWAEIHPEAAAKLGVKTGDGIQVSTDAGTVELPAYLYAGIRKDVVAVTLGQGHTAYGRYAKGRGINALALVAQATDAASGALAYQGSKAKLARGAKAMPLYLQQAEKNQHDRAIAQVIPVAALLAGVAGGGHGAKVGEAAGHAGAKFPGHYPAGFGVHDPAPSMTRPGKFTEPLARPDSFVTPAHAVTAYESKEKARSPRQNPVDVGSYKHAKHRWAMAIDLNACTGCAACVVACYAENNIPVVGPDLIKKGREMAWIRIDRFEEKLAPGANDVRFVPMMCQHCGDAPCEMVCPVYATYHNPEGLNAQVYNRCVGTRYCSNNCPYKVRAFNWFDYAAPEKTTFAFPEPLNWQLNPDVTVRSKGVMEKCTMCIQRILDGKGTAKDENRALTDGEFTTACAQSCPTQAITFGDLVDPDSQVHQKSFGERRYWVFEDLHTKPGVTYLQKVQRDSMSEGHA